MISLNIISLPLEDPVIIFSLVLLIILFSPILLSKIRVPSIIGLIVAGVIVGPYGFNLIARGPSVILLGTVGLLYIMFLAGLELDLNDFKKNRGRSLIFGALTFLAPLSIGTVVCYYALNFELTSSILVASMFATHTLIAYPIASRLGITKNEAVTIAVGGTIITDTAVLLVLAIISGTAEGNLHPGFYFQLIFSLLIFSFIVLWGFPKIGTWFFKYIKGDDTSHYIFILAMVFIASSLAEFAGVEPIIGAFLAGLALNNLVPHSSALMNRLEFVGNAIFIPFFLLSVGMLVDLRVLFRGTEALIVAGTLTGVALITKYIAAYLTQKLFNYSKTQRNVLFGLSSAHAAATIAVILVAFNLNLVDENVLNGTILLILVTCLVSSFVTESSGKKLAIIESAKKPDFGQIPERILVPIANPANMERLLEFAILIKDQKSNEPLFPLAVIKDDETAKEEVLMNNKKLESAINIAAASNNTIQVVSRIDYNVASGILKAMKELMITLVVIGWNGKITTKDRIFGSILDNLLSGSDQMILVSKILNPLNTTSRIITYVQENGEFETGFIRWVSMLKILSQQTGAGLVFKGKEETLKGVASNAEKSKIVLNAKFQPIEDPENELKKDEDIQEDDLLVVLSARKGTISYHSYLDHVPRMLAKKYDTTSFIIIFPEQNPLKDNYPLNWNYNQ